MFYLLQYQQALGARETKIISVFLEHGSDPNIKDCTGETAWHHAVYVDNSEIIVTLLVFGGDIEETTKVKFF